MQAGLKRKRDEAAAERAAATSVRAKAEADIADLEEQLSKHERMQVPPCLACARLFLPTVWMTTAWGGCRG